MANPGHGWIDVERLAPNTGNDPRFKWYRRTEDDATLFGRLIGLAESATLDARPSGDEALRAALAELAATARLTLPRLTPSHPLRQAVQEAEAALAAPVSPKVKP